ncbi:hypothetical protein SAMN04515679_4493 [Pelosinus fermentans]|uniref:HAD family hydrolase n=1 Tax=Pelosinus fermentans TaxID=365349 RepID=UPI0002684F90|nr:HAD family hydrolase [Pelosinus fermentans]OAM96299.1 HAD-superfamily hydrolase, subfamily IIB [Pelosinus fermentans DSM 17108]SDR38592.1 hypothetical protein SAMN04515679_4493 [Pelosinus fermentans]
MIKVVFVDLDHTLLNNHGELSLKNFEAIRKYKNIVKIIIATARPSRDTRFLYDVLGLDTPIINYNGGLVHNYCTCYSTTYLDPIRVKEILENLPTYENLWIESANGPLMKRWDDDTLKWSRCGNVVPKLIKEISEVDFNLLHKILVSSSSDNNLLNALKNRLNKWLEILPDRINKAYGAEIVLKELRFSWEESMAIGDDENDIELLSLVKLPVAMPNAIGKVRKLSSLVVPSNGGNGVAEALEIVLGGKK